MISKKTLGNGSIFLFANILNASIPFLLLPILTRVLTPEDYGVVTMFAIFLPLINAFVGLSVHGAINVQYFKLDSERFSEYVTSCLILLVISATIVFLIVFLAGGFFEDLIGIPHRWMLIAVVVSFFQFFVSIRLVIWVVTGRAINYGTFQISQTTINAGLSLLFVVYIGLKWEGRLLGQSIAVITFGLLALFLIYRAGYIKMPHSASVDIRDALNFGIPLIPHTIGAFVIYSTDRVVISNLLDVTSVGIYMVGLQLGQAMGLVSDSFNKVYSPWLMRNLSDHNINKEKIVKNTYLAMLTLLLSGLIWYFFASFLLTYIVGKEFQESASILLYTCLGFSLTGLYYLVTNYIFYTKNTKYLAAITFFCGALNIPLTYWLVSLNGLIGAAIAFFIIQILFFILTWLLAARVFPMPWFFFLKLNTN